MSVRSARRRTIRPGYSCVAFEQGAIVNDPSQQLQSTLDRFFAEQPRRIKVLEAGCGSLSNVRLSSDAHIVGIDVSAEALAQNTTIHERIQADLETAPLGDSEYDLIVCMDVLEHLANPRNVVGKFLKAIKPDGLVVLAFPNVLSVKGLVAKYTPFRFHLFVHRLLYGAKTRAAAGYEVCPTYLRYSIAPRSLAEFAIHRGFDVVLCFIYESGMQRRLRERFGLAGNRWTLAQRVVRLLSMGSISATCSDCVLVLRQGRFSPGLNMNSDPRQV